MARHIICIVQARMDSTRFPGKVLADLAGYPILEHVVVRAQASGLPVVVATTDRETDDPIAAWAVASGVKLFRWDGKVEDVLGRFVSCSREHHADAIIRVTADSPFIPVEVVETVSGQLRTGRQVAALTSALGTVPDGWEVEGCWTSVLRMANGSLPSSHEREHVFPGIYSRLEAECRTVPPAWESASPWSEPWLLRQKFSVDTLEDLEWLRRIAREIDCTPPRPTVKDLRVLLQCRQELQRSLTGSST